MRNLMLYTKPFENLLDRLTGEFCDFDVEGYTPATDVVENENDYQIFMEVPGYKEENLKIEVKDNNLTISGKNEDTVKKEDNREKFIIKERYTSSFKRQYRMPDNADNGNINAKLENGVLCLTVKKTEESKAKEIKIK